MCGITGWINFNRNLENEREVLYRMTKTLDKRGPDDEGFWFSKSAAIGHRRLSIVDPEGGAQPMTRMYRDKEYVITYNGELYNTPELQRELELAGHKFFTHCDTEVLLVAYIEWGVECVKKFNGIYAFGIWNEAEQSLFLARDRVGVKPLFFTQPRDSFIFGSEIKALLANPEVVAQINLEGISEVIFLGPARTPSHGVYTGIWELKPGYWLLHNREDTKLERYWKLESKPHQDNLDATARTVRELLKDSVVRQLVSDVPVCTFLSGGIDSSTITAFATEHYKEVGKGQLHTFSIDYIDNDLFFKANDFQPNSDAIWVDRVSNYLGTRHHHIFNDTPELASYLYDAVLAKDLPGMADVDSSLLLFCREVKKEAKVALSGECADEMFGGYPWFHRPELFNANTFPWSLAIEERESILNPRIAKYINAREYIDKRYYETIKDVPRLEGESGEDARRRELFYLNINWFMATLLDRKDRMSMATGLEVRVPFCDHRLLEYVWNIPWELKYYNNIEKGILRYALQGVLPNEVLYRKKSPYPKTHNPSYLETIKKWLREIIDDSNAPLHEIVNTNMLRNMLDNDEALFKRPWFGQLMNTPQFFAYMIQINIWLEKYNVKIII